MSFTEVEILTYTGEIERGEHTAEVTFTWTQYTYEYGSQEVCNEEFELKGEFVTYADLVRSFGRTAVDRFIREGRNNAR